MIDNQVGNNDAPSGNLESSGAIMMPQVGNLELTKKRTGL